VENLIANGLDAYFFQLLAVITAFVKNSAVALGAIWGLLKFIAKLTPGTRDDKIITMIGNLAKGTWGRLKSVKPGKGPAAMVLMLFMVAGCVGTQTAPSVCDTVEKSMLCDLAQDQGVRLEDIGLVLIVVNSVAIGEGLYSKDQARAVLVDLRAILDNPVSYVFFRANVYDSVDKYPELLEVCKLYLDRFTTGRIMYKADRAILISWLDDRIEALK